MWEPMLRHYGYRGLVLNGRSDRSENAMNMPTRAFRLPAVSAGAESSSWAT